MNHFTTGFAETSPQEIYTSMTDPAARETLRRQGWVILHHVAPLEPLVEALLSPLGSLMPQYGQKKFWPVEAREKGKGTSLGDQELRLHSELAEFSSPPEYLALYAERVADEGGSLRLLDVRPLLADLSQEELQELMVAEMTVKAEGPIAVRHGEFAYTGPILGFSEHGLQLRFDQHFIDKDAPDVIRKFRNRLLDYANEMTVETRQEKGTLLIWDNRFILHGRSAFSGGDRRLWRCCIRGHS